MKFPTLLAVILSIVTTFKVDAADATVDVRFFSLSPNPVNIKAGDAVYWVEADEDFGPYMISGPWGNFFTPGGIRFTGTGTYQYTASSVFGGGGWGGTVVVSPNSNLSPVVTITTPTNNSVLIAPATFAFEVEASDPDSDDVWDVEFWVGDQMIDDDYYFPYGTTVTNLAAGTYTLTAIVWDFSYATATNSISITVINPSAITLTAPSLVGGNLIFNAEGLTVGQTNILQAATDLALPWESVSTNVATSSSASFTNALDVGQRFFRLIQLP